MRKYIYIIGIVLLLTACAVRKDFKQCEEAFRNKDWDLAAAHFLKAVGKDPDNVEYRLSLAKALISASNSHLQKGKQFLEEGRLKSALLEFEKAMEYNPENNEARRQKHFLLKRLRKLEKTQREKTDIEKIKDKTAGETPPEPRINYVKKPYSLKFVRSDLKQIFNALQKASGVNFIFDEAFKSKRIALNLEDVEFMDALEKIMIQTKLFYKVIDADTIIIIPDTPAKRKDYEELVMKTVFLSNGDPESIQKTIRSLTGMKTIAVDKELNAMTLKGPLPEVKMAERIIQIYDKPKGEVFIDIEIIEVNRTRVKEYGIELSQYQVTETYLPETGAETAASTSTIRANMLPYTDASDYLLTLPSIHYKLLKSDRHSRIKARPQLRVVDQQEVKVRLGDKVPIPTTSFVPYNTAGPAQQPITSYQLQDIGINIDLTPHMHHDGLITLKMKFELTFITSPGTDTTPPTIGNRSVETIIKLKDSETSILAGLLRDTERKTMQGVPFLSRVPVLKEIFSGNKNEVEQTDIILTLTPRIIRFPDIEEQDLDYMWVGTATKPGLKPPPEGLEIEEAIDEGVDEKPIEPTGEVKKVPTQITKPKTTAAGKVKKEQDIKKEIKKPPPKPVVKQPPKIKIEPVALSLQGDKSIKVNTDADVSLAVKGGADIRIVKVEIDFDPALIRVLDVKKGPLLNKKGVKSHLLKNIDGGKGKVKVNLSLEYPLKIKEGGELITIRLKPRASGEAGLTPVLFQVFDANMKQVESEYTGLTFKVSE
jgi:general secretion pathway protein D